MRVPKLELGNQAFLSLAPELQLGRTMQKIVSDQPAGVIVDALS